MLTQKQSAALRYIRDYQTRTGGVSPSLQEIAEHLGWSSKSNVHYLLVELEGRGQIRRLKGRHRAIEIVGAMSANQPWRPAGDL